MKQHDGSDANFSGFSLPHEGTSVEEFSGFNFCNNFCLKLQFTCEDYLITFFNPQVQYELFLKPFLIKIPLWGRENLLKIASIPTSRFLAQLVLALNQFQGGTDSSLVEA